MSGTVLDKTPHAHKHPFHSFVWNFTRCVHHCYLHIFFQSINDQNNSKQLAILRFVGCNLSRHLSLNIQQHLNIATLLLKNSHSWAFYSHSHLTFVHTVYAISTRNTYRKSVLCTYHYMSKY